MSRLPQLSDFALRCALAVLFVAAIFGLGVLVGTVAQCLPPESVEAAPILVPSTVRTLAATVAPLVGIVRGTPLPLAVVPRTATVGEVAGALRDSLWPPYLHGEVMAIVACESSGDPRALGDDGRARGLFQIHGAIWGEVPEDVGWQIAQAWDIYQEWAWTPWSCAAVLR